MISTIANTTIWSIRLNVCKKMAVKYGKTETPIEESKSSPLLHNGFPTNPADQYIIPTFDH